MKILFTLHRGTTELFSVSFLVEGSVISFSLTRHILQRRKIFILYNFDTIVITKKVICKAISQLKVVRMIFCVAKKLSLERRRVW